LLTDLQPYTAPATYPNGGPLHHLLSKLVTKENVDHLGFVDWGFARVCIDDAFGEKSTKALKALRHSLIVAQWVVLGQRLGVLPAKPSKQSI
jgi:asparagine synthase (glutamine-hydrolysing)